MTRAVLWDFDGTLATRSPWSAVLLDCLDALAPGHGAGLDAVRPGLRDGFPWHTPDVGHAHAGADAWWAALAPVLCGACAGAGVSNHVPELPALVAALGLAPYFSAVVTSAALGWEKPNPRMYAAALAAAGDPDEVWMVGDNPVADVAGAEAAGIRAILVRGDGVGLAEAADVILGTPGIRRTAYRAPN